MFNVKLCSGCTVPIYKQDLFELWRISVPACDLNSDTASVSELPFLDSARVGGTGVSQMASRPDRP